MRLLWVAWLTVVTVWAQNVPGVPAPPLPAREMRGMWIATVANIDWPSRRNLPVAAQQAELRALLDGAKRLNLNTVILQVRPVADALYASPLEPWSEFLTGRMGVAPNPLWDPLEFACTEAHARGLELHAWINPFRARSVNPMAAAAPNHVSVAKPQWNVLYGRYLWLDPGNPEVRAHVLQVANDIVRRYDVDGLHLDDYFYPYPERNVDGVLIPFDDDRSYARFRQGGGTLNRSEWRRDNVNRFVEELYAQVHRTKPWVKVGLSPFGIWRPDHPQGIRGLDAYEVLFADARHWLNQGWCDYLAPQLYWPLSRTEQSFPALLQWWQGQNSLKRLMVPGLNSAKIGDDRQASDIANQIRIARRTDAAGVLFWNASSLRKNLGGVADGLTVELFAAPALIPLTPWLGGATVPEVPEIHGALTVNNAVLTLRWQHATNAVVRGSLVQSRVGAQWRQELLVPAINRREYDRRLQQVIPDEIRIVPVGRNGVTGEPAIWRKP